MHLDIVYLWTEFERNNVNNNARKKKKHYTLLVWITFILIYELRLTLEILHKRKEKKR